MCSPHPYQVALLQVLHLAAMHILTALSRVLTVLWWKVPERSCCVGLMIKRGAIPCAYSTLSCHLCVSTALYSKEDREDKVSTILTSLAAGGASDGGPCSWH